MVLVSTGGKVADGTHKILTVRCQVVDFVDVDTAKQLAGGVAV